MPKVLQDRIITTLNVEAGNYSVADVFLFGRLRLSMEALSGK